MAEVQRADHDLSVGCRFCFPPEPERIAYESPNFRVLMGLGPFVEGYALVISRTHLSCCAELDQRSVREFCEVVSLVRRAQENVFGASMAFEHGRSGACVPPGSGYDLCYHAHLHLVPASIDLAQAVRLDYDFNVLPSFTVLRRRYRNSPVPYIAFELPLGGIGFLSDPPLLPARYLRRKIADVIGDKELDDWEIFPNYSRIHAGLAKISPEIKRLSREAGA